MPQQPTHYALVIGINDYPEYGSRGRSLKGAVRDAERFNTWLQDTDRGGGLLPQNCQKIVSSGNPLAPLHADIDTALQRIWTASRRTGGDRFYFYFSGHGLSAQTDNVALCLANWSTDRRHAALSSRSYLEFLTQCTPFRELVIFLDCCRVRQGGVIGRTTELGCPVPVEGAGNKRSFVAYATEFEQAAFEAANALAGEDDEEVRGHFTEALLAALWGAAAQPAGGVTAAALKEYLERNVQLVAKASNHNQIPQVPFDLPLGAVFGSARPLANFEVRFSATRSGRITLEAPDLSIVREDDVTSGPWQLVLKPGLYCLTEVATNETLNFRFRPTETSGNVTF
jgi:hypothetical protein